MPFFHRYFSIFLTFFLHQQGITQLKYQDISAQDKEVVFTEDFDSNKNDWPLIRADIENGMYHVHDGWSEFANPKNKLKIPITYPEKLEIEIYAHSDKFSGYIYINGAYSWNIRSNKCILTGNKGVLASTNFEKNEPAYKKYTIRKIGPDYIFFLNEKFVAIEKNMELDLINHIELGFLFMIKVDYIKIYKISDNNKSSQEITSRNGNNTEGIEIKKINAPGIYYCLIFGVSDYDDRKLKLDHPVYDAQKLKEILVNKYTFPDSTAFLVLNPTRQKILAELYKLRKIISPNDNLLVFYAGHGFWDEEARQGYWWPRDASTEDPANWLSNSDLREQIRSIKSAHTLLISDACFSGGIFKTRGADDLMNAPKDIQQLYKLTSRRAMTSGTMTKVPDRSVFIEYLCKRLSENTQKYLSSQQLFDSFRSAVMNNSDTVPQDGVIAETGDEGGDFIFILKNQ